MLIRFLSGRLTIMAALLVIAIAVGHLVWKQHVREERARDAAAAAMAR